MTRSMPGPWCRHHHLVGVGGKARVAGGAVDRLTRETRGVRVAAGAVGARDRSEGRDRVEGALVARLALNEEGRFGRRAISLGQLHAASQGERCR